MTPPALLSLVLILCGFIVEAFSPIGRRGVAPSPPLAASGVVRPQKCKSPTSQWNTLTSSRKSKSQLDLVDHDLALEMGAARGAFGLCFYGALGVGSIGRELIRECPRLCVSLSHTVLASLLR